jgi:trehalose-6-phosphate synthase
MSIDTSQLKSFFNYQESSNTLKGRVINVVNHIPYHCFINNHDDNDEFELTILEKLRISSQKRDKSFTEDATPISHLERRRRSTVVNVGQTNIWHLSSRGGHSAMYAALDSLKNDYRTLYIGGTGPICTNNDKKLAVSTKDINEEEKNSLKDLLKSKHDMIPVFLDDKTSLGHYEGYSKKGIIEIFCVYHTAGISLFRLTGLY